MRERKKMTETIQGVWDRFERWAKRYKQACFKDIDRLCDEGWCDTSILYLAKAHELGFDLVSDLNLDAVDLKNRISQRIQFIRAYLVDISFDGDEFMSKHSRFLSYQYPSASERSLGVWLEQSLEEPIEAGSSFHFQDFDVSFFIKDFSDIDWVSMRSILPFDTIYLRKKEGKAWGSSEAQQVFEGISCDLNYDGYTHEIDKSVILNLLKLDFSWK